MIPQLTAPSRPAGPLADVGSSPGTFNIFMIFLAVRGQVVDHVVPIFFPP